MANCCTNCGHRIDRPKDWTTIEREFIKNNVDLCAKEISKLTGRTVASIYTFCQRNDIKLKRKGSANRG